MNEEGWMAVIFGVTMLTIGIVIALVINSGWADWFIR